MKLNCLLGETNFHFSKEGVHPSWFCYALRDKAPFKEEIDKWFTWFKCASPHNFNIHYVCCRVRRSLQFGLDIKWHRMTKSAYIDWKIALARSGNPASSKK